MIQRAGPQAGLHDARETTQRVRSKTKAVSPLRSATALYKTVVFMNQPC